MFESKKLQSYLELINTAFGCCTIAICDTLQRHTLSLAHQNLSDSELAEYSNKLGTEWIERNNQIISKALTIPYQMVRWNNWLQAEQFPADLVRIKELYNSNKEYKGTVDKVVSEFTKRSRGYFQDISLKVITERSLNYIFEECAAMLQWFEEGYDYDVYPSVRNDAISATFNLCEPVRSSILLKPIGIKLRKKDSFDKLPDDIHQVIGKNFIDNAPGHMYWKDRYGVFKECNNLQAINYGLKSTSEMIGKSDFDLLDRELATKIRENDLLVMNSGRPRIIAEETTVNGKKSVYISHKSPIKDSNGAVVGLLGVSIDITKQKELEEELTQKNVELEEALAAKTEFLNHISHEIRSPIAGFSMAADNLVEHWDTFNEEQKFEMVKVIAGTAGKIKNLSMHLIDAVKLKQGPKVFNFKDLNLSTLIENFIDEADSLYLKEKNIKINIQGDKNLTVRADEEALNQLLRNIITNSIKFSPQNSVINIETKKIDSGQVKVKISDQGVGIPEDELEQVFSQFYQSSRTKTGAGGIGLGLSIAREIILTHGGSITAKNNQDGGCDIEFTLKLARKKPNSIREKAKKRILLIDDDIMLHSSLKLSLSAKGHEMISAYEGRNGIDTLNKNREDIDVVLLDIMMPGMSGFEVLSIIKEKWPDLKVIMHSGLANDSELESSLELGAISYIKKPYKIEELVKLL